MRLGSSTVLRTMGVQGESMISPCRGPGAAPLARCQPRRAATGWVFPTRKKHLATLSRLIDARILAPGQGISTMGRRCGTDTRVTGSRVSADCDSNRYAAIQFSVGIGVSVPARLAAASLYRARSPQGGMSHDAGGALSRPHRFDVKRAPYGGIQLRFAT